jgi:hypothetical protein
MTRTPIARALGGVKHLLILVLLMTGILDALTVLLLGILVLRVLGFNWRLAWLPFGVMLVFGLVRGFRRASYRLAEQHVPALQEQLRTVADNLARESIVLEALNQEVLGKVRALQPTVFVQLNRLTRQLIILSGISFAVLAVAAANVKFLDVPQLADDAVEAVSGGKLKLSRLIQLGEEEGPTDIYGEASVAQLGLEELQLELHGAATDVNINEVREAERREFKEQQYPPDLAGAPEEAFEEQVPRGYERLVREYFSTVAQASARGG